MVVGVLLASGAAVAFAGVWFAWWPAALLWLPVGLLGAAALRFFRDPERRAPEGDALLLSPADGVVVELNDDAEHPFVGPARKVGIFMSLFDVHVNRAPTSGEVAHLRHTDGRHRNAADPRAAEENEAQEIGLKTAHGPVLVRQIAGVVARRIVCPLKTGQRLEAGERFGMVKYGSRLEVWVPKDSPLRWRVTDGSRTKAGETIIGTFDDAGSKTDT